MERDQGCDRWTRSLVYRLLALVLMATLGGKRRHRRV